MGREHADDGQARPVEMDQLSDDPRVSAKVRPPQLVGNNDHVVVAVRRILGRQEVAAEGRRDPKHAEIIRADLQAAEAHGGAGSGEILILLVGGGDGFQPGRLVLPVYERTAGSERDIVPRARHLAELNQTVGMRIRQRLEEDRIDDAEDGRVGADPKGEGDDGHDGKTGGFCELPKTELKVRDQWVLGPEDSRTLGGIQHGRWRLPGSHSQIAGSGVVRSGSGPRPTKGPLAGSRLKYRT